MKKLAVAVSADDHIQGEDGAKVTLVEYGDYQCPDCGEAYPMVKKLQRHFAAKLRLVYRNFPLEEIHEMAETAAEAAEFAGDKGKYWEMHDAIFAEQSRLSGAMLVRTAESLGLDGEAAGAAMEDQVYGERINRDIAGGKKCGVHGTPTFFINGEPYEGEWDFAELSAAIDEVLQG